MNIAKTIGAAALTGTLALSALVPTATAFACSSSVCSDGYTGYTGSGYGSQMPPAPTPMTNNFYGMGGGSFFGGTSGLGSLFVLDRLFGGVNGNGILNPNGGTSLGDLFILGQLFGGGSTGSGYGF